MIKNYVAFDLETTGLSLDSDCIIEIGALKVVEGKVCERFIEFVKPDKPISPMITTITGITNDMVSCARDTADIIRDFVSFCGDNVLVGHNIMFDYKFIKKYASQYGFPFEKNGIDTLKLARKCLCSLESRSLEALCAYYHICNPSAHRAYSDALSTAKLYHMLAHEFEIENKAIFEPAKLQFKPKKIQPCTTKQIAYLQALCEHHSLNLDCEIYSLTRSEASKMIDQIISCHGRM